MNPSIKSKVLHWNDKTLQQTSRELIMEEPLSIRVDGKPYAVIMRTPGNEIAHAAGFCLAEGLVDRLEDIHNIGFCDDEGTNVVTITLSQQRRAQAELVLDRREYISQTSCGICGKELIKDLSAELIPIEDQTRIHPSCPIQKLVNISTYQQLRVETRASHAAVLFDDQFELLTAAEDVGRHNALDKAIGHLFLEECLSKARLLILSSRISYELVQKAARARIPLVCALARPTSLAVTLAESLNMTLACLSEDDGLYIFSAAHRFLVNEY